MKDRQWRSREYASHSGLLISLSWRSDCEWINCRSIASQTAQKNQRTYSYRVIDRALGRDLRELSRWSPDWEETGNDRELGNKGWIDIAELLWTCTYNLDCRVETLMISCAVELQRPLLGYKLPSNGVTQFRRSRLSGVEFITYDRINGYANSVGYRAWCLIARLSFVSPWNRVATLRNVLCNADATTITDAGANCAEY